MIIEACVENLKQAVRAEQLGADQLELCSRLDLGGISPDVALVKAVVSAVRIPIKLMLRPRPGNFVYSEDEMQDMQKEILAYKDLPISGYVFGCLDAEHQIDLSQTNRVCTWAQGKSLTFHKAIDSCTDIMQALDILAQTEVAYILSSGGFETAAEGALFLKKMQEHSALKIIGAGKITNENLNEIASKSGLRYFHGRKIVGVLD